MTTTRELLVDRRFSGPPGGTNGGFACGTLANLLDEPAEVTLRRRLPLERALTARRDDTGGWLVEDGGEVIASARALWITVPIPPN
jgi:hypothetical protein